MIGIPVTRALQHALHAAVRVDGATGGALFTLDEAGETLRRETHLGLPDEIARLGREVPAGDGTATGNAATERRRVVIRDVAGDEYGEHTEQVLALGIRAIQATPLISDRRRVLGVLTTYYGEPHHPAPDSLRKIDLCCAIATHLLELQRTADTALRPGTVRDAARRRCAEAVRVLLPACAEQIICDEAVLITVERRLSELVESVSD